MPGKPTVISLFSGCGGMDFGFEAAGFRTAAALEIDRACCATLRHNRDWPVIEADIFGVPTRTILRAAGLRKGEADLIIGGPPCQPFSKSGYWSTGDSKRLADPRAGTLQAFLRVVEEALPRAFVLENVTGLAFAGKDEGLQYLLREIGQLNRRTRSHYNVSFRVLKAAEYGVPQVRERLFLVAARDGTHFNFPEAKFRPDSGHEELNFAGSARATYRTAWDALGDLPPDPQEEDLEMRGRWADLLPSIPEGKNYLWHTDRGGGTALFGWRRRFWNFLLKLAKDQPAWTIQAQPGPSTGPFHWRNRRLSARELCRLQTFPEDILITGNLMTVQRQVGNAVPSLLAEVIGHEILRQLLGRSRSQKVRLLPAKRKSCPPPEPVESVPAKFLVNVGAETAHPGTGRGYRVFPRASVSVA